MVLIHHYAYQLSPATHAKFAGLHFFHNGVELFFVLTGFLFAPIMLGDKAIQSSFYKRRFFRLYPVYLLSLLVIIFGVLEGFPSLLVLTQHLLLIQTLPFNSLKDAGSINLVYWTLSTEVQFYLFLVLLAGLYRTVNIPHKMALLFSLSIFGFLLSTYYQSDQSDGTWVLWQAQLPALLIEFFFGVMVYKYHQRLKTVFSVWGLLFFSLSLLTGLYHWYPTAVENAISPRPFGVFNMLSALGYAGVLASLLVLLKKVPNVLATILITTGSISYPLYLFHGITLQWLNKLDISNGEKIAAATISALIVAFLVHKLIELPCRNYGRK